MKQPEKKKEDEVIIELITEEELEELEKEGGMTGKEEEGRGGGRGREGRGKEEWREGVEGRGGGRGRKGGGGREGEKRRDCCSDKTSSRTLEHSCVSIIAYKKIDPLLNGFPPSKY